MHANVKFLRGTSVEEVLLRGDNLSAKVEFAVRNKTYVSVNSFIMVGFFFLAVTSTQ
jgi:hypothetical protein